jgi:hypothetical protein
VRGGLPANDHAREDVVDEGQVEEPLAGLQVGEIAHPELVRALGDEAPLDQIGRARRGLVGDREPAPQRLPHPSRPLGAGGLFVHRLDAGEQPRVLIVRVDGGRVLRA